MVAAVLTAVLMFVHIFAGGRGVVVPLLRAADLGNRPKTLSYLCWHAVTIMIGFMSVSLFWAAFFPAAIELAVAVTLLNFTVGIYGLFMIHWRKHRLLRMPQWAAFLLVSFVSGMGLWA